MNVDKFINQWEALGRGRRVRELRHCRNLTEGMLTPLFIDAAAKCDWPENQLPGLCVALILAAHATNSDGSRRLNQNGFIAAWARQSVDKSASRGIDINEHRFIKLIKSTDWDEFFDAAFIGAKLLLQRDKTLDIHDMIEWIKFRADEWECPEKYGGSKQFAIRAYDVFIGHQPTERKKS